MEQNSYQDLKAGKRSFYSKLVASSLLLTVIALLACGCARNRVTEEERRLSVLRPTAPGVKTVNIELNREKLIVSLSNKNLFDQLRVVQVYRGTTDGNIPLYRLFEIDPRSVYSMLGLRNADIVVAANDRILANPDVFRQYVSLLPRADEAQIEIIRDGVPTLFKYNIVGETVVN